MRRLGLILLLALVGSTPRTATAFAEPEAQQLSAEGQDRLHKLLDQIQQGALAPEITGAAVKFAFQGLGANGAVRVELRSGDHLFGITLLQPPTRLMDGLSRKLVLFPDDDVPPAMVSRFSLLADSTFGGTNPWAPTSPDGLFRTRPVSRAIVYAGMLFLFASTLLAIGFLLVARPKERGVF
jgi:hypothetical protein